jgi:hypothetical protein
MVQTIKMSDFAQADLGQSGNQVTGFDGGINIKAGKVVTWTNVTRPPSTANPTPPFDGLLGYNSDIQQYEFWSVIANKWIQLLDSSNGLNWTTITVVSVNAAPNNGYITNRSSTPVQVVLPAVFNIGDVVEVLGLGHGGWSLVANAGQTIVFGSVATSTAGAINSDIDNANIIVKGLVANTTWTVTSINSNPTYV